MIHTDGCKQDLKQYLLKNLLVYRYFTNLQLINLTNLLSFLFQKQVQEALQEELNEVQMEMKNWRKVAEDRRQELLQLKLEMGEVVL